MSGAAFMRGVILELIRSPVEQHIAICLIVFSKTAHSSDFCGNQPCVLFAIFTSINMTGTSVNTPTVVARAAESAPNRAMATATDNSKKFDAPIIPAGAAMLKGSFKVRAAI